MEYTAQQIFDTVVTHLRKQKIASLNHDGECMYRGNEGRMCAVGVLIPDEAYDPCLEQTSVSMLYALAAEQENDYLSHGDRRSKVVMMRKHLTAHPQLKQFVLQHRNLLEDLQNLHDHSLPSQDIWETRNEEGHANLREAIEEQFQQIATKHNLNYTTVDA